MAVGDVPSPVDDAVDDALDDAVDDAVTEPVTGPVPARVAEHVVVPVSALEARVLEATKVGLERWGFAKLTIDDIANEARVSRATIYRMFPGGKDVLFEAVRVRELEAFFDDLKQGIVGVDSLEELLVRTVVTATRRLRDDDHLALMLAAEPGTVLTQLTSDGVPRIIRMATAFLVPFVDPYLCREAARAVIDVLSRLTISYFLAPSDVVDLGDETSARAFLAPFIDTLTTPGAGP